MNFLDVFYFIYKVAIITPYVIDYWPIDLISNFYFWLKHRKFIYYEKNITYSIYFINICVG